MAGKSKNIFCTLRNQWMISFARLDKISAWCVEDSHGFPRIPTLACQGSKDQSVLGQAFVCPHVGLPENGAGNLLDFHPFSNYLATSLWRMTSWRNQPISWANISGLGIDIFEYWSRPNLTHKTGENGADMIDGAISLPVVPHKAVAEVSKIGHVGEVSCCDAWMAERFHWWTEKWLWSPHPQLLVVCCSVAIVVVVA